MKTNPNDPVAAVPDIVNLSSSGLTKREYFAALAMQGLLASPVYCDARVADIAKLAADQSDELIATLNRTETP